MPRLCKPFLFILFFFFFSYQLQLELRRECIKSFLKTKMLKYLDKNTAFAFFGGKQKFLPYLGLFDETLPIFGVSSK